MGDFLLSFLLVCFVESGRGREYAGALMEISLCCGFWGWNSGLRLGKKHSYLLSHLPELLLDVLHVYKYFCLLSNVVSSA